ncbi:hypothetical protein HMPREF9622_00259 [Cutibacterium modestum HL037PA3]|uniref:Uncharacterized protein n=1 Tax=Cutibacterium modestum HL044PA1 TaxID=765109 RepID=A0ABP2K6P9_9ACTN|nr:hypothetical protein HMPREF9621_00237 [Cutibacterium modestum HL037PA2]EFS91271.1 hypothetical protein HMPREF9607_02562 [Cutibacterium modestum HL044PA1]EFT16715.1 hypothetical protein HMPREF9622_00259 [Cutibacterium modestum HL037PA3]
MSFIVTNVLVGVILVITAVRSRRHHVKHFNQKPHSARPDH